MLQISLKDSKAIIEEYARILRTHNDCAVEILADALEVLIASESNDPVALSITDLLRPESNRHNW